MPIDQTLSTLMTDDRVRSYDALEAQFLKIREGIPPLSARTAMEDLLARLANLKRIIERPRYNVGFLGRSQVGKSSTLNSILNAISGRRPGHVRSRSADDK